MIRRDTLCCALLALGLTGAGCGTNTGSSGVARGAPPVPPPDTASTDLFRDVAREAGLEFRWGHGGRSPLTILETLGHGCAFLDYDQDGLLDAFLVGNRRCGLFRNLGGGRFSDVTAQAGLTAEGELLGLAVGDYDNDGYPDVYVTGYGTCVLYHNTRRGGFEDVTARSGLAARGPYDMVTAAAFADLDGDGKLDLFGGRYIKFTRDTIHFCEYHGIRAGCGVKNYDPDAPRAYRNNGNGTFSDFTAKWGFDQTHGRCLGVSVSASDRGRGVHLYAANDELPGDLMVPQGGGYKNAGVSSGTAFGREGLTQGGMGVDWGDINNDGLPELVVSTFQNEPNSLYRNDGDGVFIEAGAQLGVAGETTRYVAWTAKLFDYDNDGWLDLMFTNGHSQDNVMQIEPDRTYPQRMQLFRNQGGRRLSPVTVPALERPIVGRGAAYGDYDNDGRTDVLVVDEEGPAQLLHNDAPAGHWLGIRLRGTRSNRDGIGARVTVKAGGKTYVRDVQLAGGYISAHDPRLVIGLGENKSVASIAVRWPSGAQDRVKAVPVDTYVQITEGSGRFSQ